eukprot:6205520-Pleurochrysis_carterae.AAC.1
MRSPGSNKDIIGQGGVSTEAQVNFNSHLRVHSCFGHRSTRLDSVSLTPEEHDAQNRRLVASNHLKQSLQAGRRSAIQDANSMQHREVPAGCRCGCRDQGGAY